MKQSRIGCGLVAAIALIAVGAALAIFIGGALRSNESREISSTIVTTLLGETEQQYLVTGQYQFLVERRLTDERRVFSDWVPRPLNPSLGRNEVEVRVPVAASYGLDLSSLLEEDVTVAEDGSVRIRLPALSVFAVDTDTQLLEYRTQRGWARRPSGIEEMGSEAFRGIRPAIEDRAVEHIKRAEQPRLNTEEAVRRILRPVLVASGYPDPVIEFIHANEAGQPTLIPQQQLESRPEGN
ncbi:hypothetical protein BH23BAC4_BH23BAC4_05230 [soil metagenome]